ncbi:S1C family serine protease [Bradyrhizobium sp. Tv2a-2]|uniref:S1C family serine protease n=1 Tax=Bradyrhizobium sp. Tv2a-2 TaxID=113395 RepID=UPI00041B8FE8|nr:S1C family serine protease [Bradyrhizobium sp. Tv2a-2]
MTDSATSPLAAISSSLADVVARTSPAIVSVHSHRSRASGFVWKPGLVITADEALADEGAVTITLADGAEHTASIVGRDHTTDVALLRTGAKTIPPIVLAQVVPPLGTLAVVVATERGAPTASLGMVSLVGERWRSLRGGDIDARIELDVRLRHSHEGGLALDAAGRAFGMAVLGPRRVLTIPAGTIERVATRLETHGRIARGYLGVGLQPVRLDDGVGAMVMSVDKQGPAAQAGIRQGDVIVAVNNERIAGVRALIRSLGPDSVGSTIDLALQRAGEPVNVKLTVGERPET